MYAVYTVYTKLLRTSLSSQNFHHNECMLYMMYILSTQLGTFDTGSSNLSNLAQTSGLILLFIVSVEFYLGSIISNRPSSVCSSSGKISDEIYVKICAHPSYPKSKKRWSNKNECFTDHENFDLMMAN